MGERRPTRAILAAWAAVAFALGTGGCGEENGPAPPPAEERPQRLPKVRIRVGDVPLEAEVADAPAERERGMMFRRRLGPDEAMLFVFPAERTLGFWMKNTPVDLDLAYIASDGTILQISRLRAHDTRVVFSREPARMALEVPAGWLAAHGIREGDRVAVPPEVLRAAE